MNLKYSLNRPYPFLGENLPYPSECWSLLVKHMVSALIRLCLQVAAVVLGSCYFAFVGYIAMEYAESWLEKLRMLPLLIASLTIPLLGAVLIRKKHRIWRQALNLFWGSWAHLATIIVVCLQQMSSTCLWQGRGHLSLINLDVFRLLFLLKKKSSPKKLLCTNYYYQLLCLNGVKSRQTIVQKNQYHVGNICLQSLHVVVQCPMVNFHTTPAWEIRNVCIS